MNFHHATFCFLQALPVSVTKDLRALGAQDTEALQVPYPCQVQGPLYPRALGPQVQPPALAESMASAALANFPDPAPRAPVVPEQDDDSELPPQEAQWLQRVTEELAVVNRAPATVEDEWAREATRDWGAMIPPAGSVVAGVASADAPLAGSVEEEASAVVFDELE